MATKKLLTVFGATGNQGGSVIDTILADAVLQDKYSVRGITRHMSSSSAKALTEKGVEMVAADLNDIDSLRNVLRGSHGVFGVTNFWDKDVMSKDIEIQQGKNIFEACQAEGVVHFVFSTLPHASNLTKGELQHIDHFDGKAIVAEYIESHKKNMIASYFMPAMYTKSYKDQIMMINGTARMIMPSRRHNTGDELWPIIDARKDTGKYVMGLLEAGTAANGIRVHGVSVWVTRQAVLAAINKISKIDVVYEELAIEKLQGMLPAEIAREIAETMQLVVDYNYYGPGEEQNQDVHKAWLYNHQKTASFEELLQSGSPWTT